MFKLKMWTRTNLVASEHRNVVMSGGDLVETLSETHSFRSKQTRALAILYGEIGSDGGNIGEKSSMYWRGLSQRGHRDAINNLLKECKPLPLVF